MFASMNPNLTPISRDHNKKLVKIIQALLSLQQSNLFRKPIPHKSLGWEDYKEIIKKPIDLNLVRRQYNEGKYKTVQQFFDDIQTIWENVFLYGKKQHQTHELALKMQKHYDQLIHDYFPQYHQKIDRVTYMKKFQTQISTQKQSKKGGNYISSNTNNNIEKQKTSNNRNSASKFQKMDLQIHPKQQIQENHEQNISNKKKQSSGNNKKHPNQYTYLQKQNPPVVSQKQEVSQKNSHQSSNLNQKVQLPSSVPIVPQQSQLKQTFNQSILVQQPIKPQPIAQNNSTVIPIPPQVSSLPIQMIEPESQGQNQFPPIMVNLNQTPSLQQISELTQIMNHLFQQQQFELMQKIVKILTKYQKENMIIDGQDVNFRMNQIHISTYWKIKKQLQTKALNYMNGNHTMANN